MSDQNIFSQQPQYIDPQQPQFTAAPQPVYDAPTSSAEPEVILQESPFADFGFDESDSIGQGHNFGGFMEDDNSPAEELDGFNAFNSQTPNFSLEDVETASKAASTEEKAMFTATTVNFDIGAVEEASKAQSADDINIFSNAVAVGEREQTTSDSPTFDAATAVFSGTTQESVSLPNTPPAFDATPKAEPAPSAFMASMASMFSSLNGTSTPVEDVPEVETPIEGPKYDEAPVEVSPVEETPVVFATPDTVVNAPETTTIQDISSTSAESGKSDEYWNSIDKMLNNFDDGQPHQEETETVTIEEKPVEPIIAAPSMPAAPSFNVDSVIVDEPAEEPEEKKNFPFSESAQVAEAKPVAQSPVQVSTPTFASFQDPANNIVASESPVAAAYAPQVSESQPSFIPTDIVINSPIEEPIEEEIDKKAIKAEEKAKRAEEKAANKAAKVEARAQKKAEKLELKAQKKNSKVEKEPKEEVEKPEKKRDSNKPQGFKGVIYTIFPNKNDSTIEILRKVVAFVSAIALLVCAVYFLVTFISSKSHQKDANKLSEMMLSGESSAEDWAKIYEKYPNIQFPTGMQAKFADLYAINQDLVGWISIKGLGIDYPVVQTTDDSFYLKHDYYKQSSAYGTIFLSAGNNISPDLDLNTVVYGHAMRRDKQMFSRLHDYKEKETFIENPIIEFNTLYGNYKFKVYCTFITNGSTADDNGFLLDYTFTNLSTTESFAGFVAEINERRLYSTGVDILPNDKIICLSTCSYEFDNARFVVVGRLVRDGESLEIDASKVADNDNPRYPQTWYDSNKQTNPYANYTHWTPS